MGRLLTGHWYFLGEEYSEQTVLAKYSYEDATGQSGGVVALVKEKVVKLFCCCPAGTSLPEHPTANANNQLVLRCLGTSGTVTLAGVSSTNSITSATSVDVWTALGPNVAVGYESEELGIIRWECKMSSDGMDIKRGTWYGTMTPAKFRDMANVNPQ